MGGDETPTEELKRQQAAEERAEREQLANAGGEAEAERHRRRADKAGYLREKLEERARSEQQAGATGHAADDTADDTAGDAAGDTAGDASD